MTANGGTGVGFEPANQMRCQWCMGCTKTKAEEKFRTNDDDPGPHPNHRAMGKRRNLAAFYFQARLSSYFSGRWTKEFDSPLFLRSLSAWIEFSRVLNLRDYATLP
jgi:hypothetical protein